MQLASERERESTWWSIYNRSGRRPARYSELLMFFKEPFELLVFVVVHIRSWWHVRYHFSFEWCISTHSNHHRRRRRRRYRSSKTIDASFSSSGFFPDKRRRKKRKKKEYGFLSRSLSLYFFFICFLVRWGSAYCHSFFFSFYFLIVPSCLSAFFRPEGRKEGLYREGGGGEHTKVSLIDEKGRKQKKSIATTCKWNSDRICLVVFFYTLELIL